MNRYERFFRRLSQASALWSMVAGSVVLIGWYMDSALLKGAYRTGIVVKANTAVAFFLCGAALLLQCAAKLRMLRLVLSGLVGLIGGLTLVEHLSGFDLGIDQILFKEEFGAPATTFPNRMGPPASLYFMLFSAALITLEGPRRRPNIAAITALIVFFLALLPALGYLFGARELFGIAQYTGIAFPSAVTFMFVSIGILGISDGSTLIKLLTSRDAGGTLARRLLPAAVAVPPTLAVIRTLGEQEGLYDPGFGRALLIVAIILIFSRLIWTSAHVLQKLDDERRDLLLREKSARLSAESASRFKDEFIAVVSHELRTPLNAVLGWVYLLKRQIGDSPDLLKGLVVIERNARLQAQLINDLLDLSRIDSGKIKMQMDLLDPADPLRAALDTVGPSASQKGINVISDIPRGSAQIRGDFARLQQIFWNLLTNGVKFTPSGGTVKVSMTEGDGAVHITVADTGEGIAAENISTIFDRFTQAESSSSRAHGGLGIGLSIARDLVKLHGGTIAAQSEGRTRGATFSVSLPLEMSTTKRKVQGSPTAVQNLPSSFDLRGVTILVVDDDADAREFAHQALSQHGAIVVVASSVAEAMECLKESVPTIVVSDIGMPYEDGFALLRRMGESPDLRTRNTPAIAVTAFASQGDRSRVLEAGFKAHLAKPIEVSELVATLRDVLGELSAPAQLRTPQDL